MNLIGGDPRKMFKDAFNSDKTEINRIKKTIKSITEPEINKTVGKTIKLANRTIYPIIQTYVFRNENQDFITAEVFPIALVIEEPDNEYFISIMDNDVNPEELIKTISPEDEQEKKVVKLLMKCSK